MHIEGRRTHFEDLFALVGMSLDDPANRLFTIGHKGPHPAEYHAEVHRRLQDVFKTCTTATECKAQFIEALDDLASDIQDKPVRIEREPFLPLSRPGRALDFTQTEVGIVVVSQRFVSLCKQIGVQDEVQLIPARVEGQRDPYFILNTLRIIRCVDEARCEEVTFWEPRHGAPHKVGHYRNVAGLRIDPTKVGDANIFRPWGWTVALIVSERVKLAMEKEGLTGAKFIEV
ncbi:MAG: AHH domain-containing protein [Archangium sp.]